MKKFLVASSLALALSACSTPRDLGLAEPISIPDLPEGQFEKAGPLPKLEDRSLSALQLDAAKTDAKYNQVSINYNRLIDFYNCVKESINEEKEPKCF